MRSSSMTAIAEGPAAPLSPRTRADLRADRPPPPAPFVRSESGRRLARALDRFARGERDRDALLVHGPQGSGRSTVVHRAVEQAMVALTWLDRPVQLLPVHIRTSALWSSGGDRFDEVRVISRFLAVAALNELVERVGARIGDGSEQLTAVEELRLALRGVPERDALRSLRSAAEPRYSLFGDDDDVEEDESVGREANVLWQAVRLRGVRPPALPTPIIEQVGPSVDPAVVEALRAEVSKLSSALADRDATLAAHLERGAAGDPAAVVLAAIAGAGLGLHFGTTGGIVGGIVGGGLGFFLANRGKGDGGPAIELAPLPVMADPPTPVERPTEPMPAADENVDEAVADGPPDVDALIDLLRHFIHDLRSVGYAPVFILDELDRAHRDPSAIEARIARLLADLPDGACAILVAEDAEFGRDVPEITDRLSVSYAPAALHAYLDHRIALPDDLSETAAADARLDKAILRYALLHASRMRPEALIRMLEERRLGSIRLDAQTARSVYSLRIRAAQQLALEVVLGERGGHPMAGGGFDRILAAALQLPLVQWETGQKPDITVEDLEAHVRLLHPEAWSSLDSAARDKIWSALGLLLGLMSSRAGLVARLPVSLAPLADFIPDAPLVVRDGDGWAWAFDAEGQPTAAGLGDEPREVTGGRIQGRPSANEMGARFRAIAGQGAAQALEAPRRLRPGDPLPLTGEYRAYAAGLLPPDGEQDGSMDGSVDEPRSGVVGTRRPLIDAAEAARFLEGVDEALAGIGEGALSVQRLARVGLVPTIPAPAAVARALAEGDTPNARVVLDEAVGRIRERLGIIEKFALWLTAARTLVPDDGIGTLQIAATLVKARALRGRPASAQHAHLVNRVLQSELRSLCPRLRLKTSIFRRQANPGTDPDALARWGEVLRRKCDDLAEALAAGTTEKSLDRVAWRALRTRLRLLVIDGEAGLPTFAEAIAALVGVAGATVTDWLTPEPTARNLSALLLAAREHSQADRLGDGGLYAALALGLNQNGTDAVGLELPEKETSEAGDLIRESARARAPVALVLTTDPNRGLAASRPPRRGSALVLTPDEVITSTKKLGFEVIFLDDPNIDAGMLPLPPAPVLAPPQTDDIDAALGWWTTHR